MKGEEEEAKEEWVDDGSLPLVDNTELPFFLLDAHEEAATPGLIYLFGKVRGLVISEIAHPSLQQPGSQPSDRQTSQEPTTCIHVNVLSSRVSAVQCPSTHV